MSNTHPVTIVVFLVLLALALYSELSSRKVKPKEVPAPSEDRALKRRTDPVWKDRGTL